MIGSSEEVGKQNIINYSVNGFRQLDSMHKVSTSGCAPDR